MQRKILCVLVCFLIWGLCTCQLANHGRSPSRLRPNLQRILNGNVVQHTSGNPPVRVERITSVRRGGMYNTGGRRRKPCNRRRYRRC